MKRTGLGRGIGALFDQNQANDFINTKEETINEVKIEPKKEDIVLKNIEQNKLTKKEVNNENINNLKDQIIELKLIDIIPNPKQARKVFDKQKLDELSNSIKMFGVLQPILVEKSGDYYNIIAGERRWRASKIAGKKTIPAIISNNSKSKNAQISIVENLQREDLNPVEKARGLDELMKEFNLSGNEVSEVTGINFSSIFNSLKILKLDNTLLDEMQNMPNLTEQACLALLETDNINIQKEALMLINEKGLSATEALKRLKLTKNLKKEKLTLPPIFTDIENKFEEYFGNKVQIRLNNSKKNSGKIIINYNSQDDLERIIGLIE